MDYKELKSEIRCQLCEEDLWGQLAEEASELAQAAEKMRRITSGRNLPACSREEAIANLYEEMGDIDLVLAVLDGYIDICAMGDVMFANYEYKLQRWHDRLEQESNGGNK